MNKKFPILFSLIIFILSTPLVVRALTVQVTAMVPGCGDGLIGVGEQCDGSNLGGASCVTLGYQSGSLSCTAGCTFNTSSCSSVPPVSGGGGGGGGGYFTPTTNVVISGWAYPLSRISFMKDGQVVLTNTADLSGNFTGTISGLSTGNYLFGVYAQDVRGTISAATTFPLAISSGTTTKVDGVLVPPSATLDKSQVKQGEYLSIVGTSVPGALVTLSVNPGPQFTLKKNADVSTGAYSILVNTASLPLGQYSIVLVANSHSLTSQVSRSLPFAVGLTSVEATSTPAQETKAYLKGDLNEDGRVNLLDFSIAAYWYKKKLSTAFTQTERNHLNGDAAITLADFSIMAFYWTG